MPVADPASAERVTARHVLAVLAVGAVARFALLRLPQLWFDEATAGLTGLAVLHGDLPVYFVGQPFMGVLGDGYLTAPLLLLFGISARTLESVPVLLSILWLGLVVRFAWEAFGRRPALFTAALVAIPADYLFHWSHEARPHYVLILPLGALALLVALRAPTVAPPRAALHYGLLGFVLGLAFWTNFLSVVYVPAVAALVLLRRPLRRAVPYALTAIPMFLLGSLPHWLYGLQHGTALPPAGGRMHLAAMVAYLQGLGHGAWPLFAGVPAPLRGALPGTLIASALAVVYGWALVAAARAGRDGAPPARPAALALVVLCVTTLGIAVGTRYGRFLADDARYLLPLYLALPLAAGRWLAGFSSQRAAAGLVGALLLVHVAGALTGEFRNLAPAVAAAERGELQAQLDTVAALEQQGLRRLYAPDFGLRVLTFLSAERVIVSSHYGEIFPRYALDVDGAETVGWWLGNRSPVFEANLAALGVRFAFRPAGPFGGVYSDFAVTGETVRELDPSPFSVTASVGGDAVARIVDRDAGTLWGTGAVQRGGEWIQIDLGRVEPVAMIRWLPGTYQEVPTGLTLEVSGDGRAWQQLVGLPSYMGPLYWSAGRPMARVRSGRVEIRMPRTPARHLRMTQTGRNALWPWTIRELFVYAATGAPAVAPTVDGQTLAAAVRSAGVGRLFADHGWGSRVALADPGIRILPANLHLDAYGFTGSARDFIPPVHWGPGAGALLEPVDAEGFARAARAGGLGFTERAIGGLALFAYAPPTPLDGVTLAATGFTVTASRQPERAALAIDGKPQTRWGTGHPRTPGDWFRIDVGTPRVLRAVRLWTANPADAPRGLALEGSADGVTWRPLAAELRTEGAYRWGGIALLRDGIEAVRLDFAPVTLRALRLTLTRGDPVFDWSIHELTVYAGE